MFAQSKGYRIMECVYDVILNLCKEKGITIAQLTREAGVSKSTLSELKMGRSSSLSQKNVVKN